MNNKQDGSTKQVEVVIDIEDDKPKASSTAESPSRGNGKDEAPPSAASSPHLSEFEALLERLQNEKKGATNGSNFYVLCYITCVLSIFFYCPM